MTVVNLVIKTGLLPICGDKSDQTVCGDYLNLAKAPFHPPISS